MRVNIYLATKELHDSMKDQAGREGCSLSEYLVKIHSEHLGCLGNDSWKEKKEKPSKSVQRRLAVQKKPSGKDFFNPQPKKKK